MSDKKQPYNPHHQRANLEGLKRVAERSIATMSDRIGCHKREVAERVAEAKSKLI